MTTSQTLPSKENALFRSVVKNYETKQYKKGLKTCEQILKKFPQHGETLAMKGLVLNCLNRKDSAFEFVRLGLKQNVSSHVCWHVYGLLHRADSNYHEAIKCYRNALRIDQANLQIMRDLYLLQVQIRDLKGFAETRRMLLTYKPSNRTNWIGFAIAHHLNGNHQMAINIIDKYVSTLETSPSVLLQKKMENGQEKKPLTYDDSELLLYRNLIVKDMGDTQQAYDHLEESKDVIMDKTFAKKRTADYCLEMGQYERALVLYQELLQLNNDDYQLHRGIQSCLLERSQVLDEMAGCELPSNTSPMLTTDQKQILLNFYDAQINAVTTSSKKVNIFERIALDLVEGEEFKNRVGRYVQKQLIRGVPSLGSDLKSLYKEAANNPKVAILEELLLAYLKNLKEFGQFETGLNSCDDASSTSAYLWTMYLVSQHYDQLKNYCTALEYIEKCIEHTPTVLDFHQRKGRFLKHAGDLKEAAKSVVQGRLLDLADRYINNKATEYLFHAGEIKEADDTISLFTRHEGDPQRNLYDMQCMWYENECGQAYFAEGNYGMALKRFFAVEKHFNDFVEDQFDFHSYCLRKTTLRAYIQMIRMCDTLYRHKSFQKAAHGIIDTYLALLDIQIKDKKASQLEEENLSKMTPAEKKKMKRLQAKQRKKEFQKKKELAEQSEDEKRKKKEEDEAELQEKAKKKHNGHANQQEDLDPRGESYLLKDPLDEAWRIVTILQEYLPSDLNTHCYAFDVAFRREKYLLCLQALKRMLSITKVENYPELLKRVAIFYHEVETASSTIPDIVMELIKESRSEFFSDSKQTVPEYLIGHLKSNLSNLNIRIAIMESYVSLSTSLLDLTMLGKLLNDNVFVLATTDGKDISIKNCSKILEIVQANDKLFSNANVDQYRQLCLKKYPYATAFGRGYKSIVVGN